MTKPKLSFWQIWNLSFGFLGVQIGYSLQNSNTSSIFESLGADVHDAGVAAGWVVRRGTRGLRVGGAERGGGVDWAVAGPEVED